jgi:P27 family predicted phage terminase small subunit
MKPGPPPKPRALRVLEGVPGHHRPLGPDIRPTGDLTMPRHLKGAARTEWQRVVPQLKRLGIASALDRACIAAYCASWQRWLKAEENLERYGAIVKSPSGFPMLSPYVSIAAAALKNMRAFAAELGLTPAARTRVQADETAPTFPQPNRHTSEGTAPRPSPARFFHD